MPSFKNTRTQVVRLIPRPSPRSIGIGDVVAFNSPLDTQGRLGLYVCVWGGGGNGASLQLIVLCF